jgi:hypothetical protein
MKVNQIKANMYITGLDDSKRKYSKMVNKLVDTWKVVESIHEQLSLWKPSFYLSNLNGRFYSAGVRLDYDQPCEVEESIKDVAIARKLIMNYSDNSIPLSNVSYSSAKVVDFGDFSGEWKFEGVGVIPSSVVEEVKSGNTLIKATVQRNYKTQEEARKHANDFADKVSYYPVDTLFELHGQEVLSKEPHVTYTKLLKKLDQKSLNNFFDNSSAANQVVFVHAHHWDASPNTFKPEGAIYVPFNNANDLIIATYDWKKERNKRVTLDLKVDE